jgi:septal ring factor EnvC (AmiA/AmiB activator)
VLLQIDPDAPWWANLTVLILVLAVVPALSTWVTGRGAKKKVAATQADVATTQVDVAAIREQVENTHTSNLRDDIDNKISSVIEAVEQVRDDVGGLHSEVRDTRDDITGIRTDARRDRRLLAEQRQALDEHLSDVPRLVADTVRQAQTTTTTSTTTSTTPAPPPIGA